MLMVLGVIQVDQGADGYWRKWLDADAGNMYRSIKTGYYRLIVDTTSHTGLTDGPYESVFSGLNGSGGLDQDFYPPNPSNIRPHKLFTAMVKTRRSTTVGVGSSLLQVDLYDGTGSALERSNFSFSPEDFFGLNKEGKLQPVMPLDVLRGGNKTIQMRETEILFLPLVEELHHVCLMMVSLLVLGTRTNAVENYVAWICNCYWTNYWSTNYW